LLGEPKGRVVTIKDLRLKDGAEVSVLEGAGIKASATWKQDGTNVVLTLPEKLLAKYAYGMKMVGVE
jgi:hypothetical protein